MRLGNPNLAIDSKLEEDGKWVDCPSIWWRDASTPMRVLVRGKSAKRHMALIRAKTKGLTNSEINEKAEEIAAELTENLVAGWEGWFDVDGNAVPYTVATCRSIVSDPDNRELVDYINRVSDQSTFRVDDKEEVEKNSRPS